MVRILIIEDDGLQLEMLRQILEADGYQVTAAPDGEQGMLRLSEDDNVNLVLTDISMPKMDGSEFIREIRLRAINVPVIVMTGAVSSSFLSRARDASVWGADAVLSKPYSIGDLKSTIKAVLNRACIG
jgi:DNA-binding response OmpR family regulator